MHDMSRYVLPRLQRFMADRLEPGQYRFATPVAVTSWEVPDEPVPFADAVGQRFELFADTQFPERYR